MPAPVVPAAVRGRTKVPGDRRGQNRARTAARQEEADTTARAHNHGPASPADGTAVAKTRQARGRQSSGCIRGTVAGRGGRSMSLATALAVPAGRRTGRAAVERTLARARRRAPAAVDHRCRVPARAAASAAYRDRTVGRSYRRSASGHRGPRPARRPAGNGRPAGARRKQPGWRQERGRRSSDTAETANKPAAAGSPAAAAADKRAAHRVGRRNSAAERDSRDRLVAHGLGVAVPEVPVVPVPGRPVPAQQREARRVRLCSRDHPADRLVQERANLLVALDHWNETLAIPQTERRASGRIKL